MGLPGVETLPVLCRSCRKLVPFSETERIGDQRFCRDCAGQYTVVPEPCASAVNWFHVIWGIGCLIVGVAGFSYCSDQMRQATDMSTNYSWGKAILAIVAILGFVELLIGFMWQQVNTPERAI